MAWPAGLCFLSLAHVSVRHEMQQPHSAQAARFSLHGWSQVWMCLQVWSQGPVQEYMGAGSMLGWWCRGWSGVVDGA